MYIRCQSAPLYQGSRTDKQGPVVHHGKNTEQPPSPTTARINSTVSKESTAPITLLLIGDERCPFSCSIFLDSAGYYYLKTATNYFLRQARARCDHIRTSTTLLHADKYQIQGNVSSARAKTGVVANLHYVRPGRQGTKSILSHAAQIKALLKKNPHQENGNDADESMNGSGETDNLYQFLEKSGSHYVFLLACVVPEASMASIAYSPSIAGSPCQRPTQSDSPPKTVLFNKTWLGHTKDQEDIVIAADKEQTCFVRYQTIMDGYYPLQTPRK
jgi:hypothetical protein